MARILLEDTISFKLGAKEPSGKPVIQEAVGGGKLVAHGRYALADVPTANGRVYKRALWQREIARLSDAMKARRVFGEADHPSDGRTKLTRVAHILTDLVLTEDGEILGTAEIMNTSAGKELQAIIAAGGSIGVSSRGYGSVSQENGHDVVDDDYQLDTFDFVVDPAQGTAYPEFHVENKNKPEGTVIKEGDETKTAPQSTPSDPTKETKKEDAACDADKKKEEDDKAVDDKPKTDQPKTESVKDQIEQAVARAKAELREEVKSQLLSDPKVAGATVALESVKNILRPYILDKDVNVALEERDLKVKALEEQLAALSVKLGKAKTENVALSKAVKDLGFNLYVTKTLAGHPKLESLLKSFGDLTLIESADALKQLVEPHKDGLKTVRTEEVSDARKLITAKDAEVKRLSEALQKMGEANKKVSAERDEAMQKAHTASLGLYLERKIVGNSRASAIRLKFKEMTNKSKDSVDALVEAFVSAPTNRGSDFSRIRSRLKPGSRPSATLVEDSIRDTGAQAEGDPIQVMEGINMDADRINRLAGIK